MSLRGFLKQQFNALREAFKETYTPFKPAPDVQAYLEKQGYQFKTHVVSVSIYSDAIGYSVIAPNGESIGDSLWGAPDETTEQYMRDYDNAVKIVNMKNSPEHTGPKVN